MSTNIGKMRTVLVFASLIFCLITFVKSENKVILNHSPGNDFLILKCNIIDASCCTNMKEVEFFKNGNGVCSVTNCQNRFSIPLPRDDAEFYKCGCAERDIRNTYIHVTKYRASDNGNWTCGCYGKENGRKCHSAVMVISKETFDNGANILNNKLTTCTVHLHYIIMCTGLVFVLIIALVVLICILRRKVQVKVIKPTRLTNLLFGKKYHEEKEGNKELRAPLVNVPVSNSSQENSENRLLSDLVEKYPILVNNAAFKVFTPKRSLCGHCTSTKKDAICCRKDFEENGCFSQSQAFISECLNKKALFEFFQCIKNGESSLPAHVAEYLIKRHEITTEDLKNDVPIIRETNKSFRALAYTKCKVLLPSLEVQLFSPVPPCITVAIRNAFPDPYGAYDT